jgi:hypothetical protein
MFGNNLSRVWTKRLNQTGLAASVLIAVAAICWWGYNLVGLGVAGAFEKAFHSPSDPNADVLMLLWSLYALLAILVCWDIAARYRSTFGRPRLRRRSGAWKDRLYQH